MIKQNLLKYKILKKFLKIKFFIKNISIQQAISYLQLSAIILLILLLSIILWNVFCGNSELIIPLVGALAILISALLASYSVMLSIDTTIKIKNKEHSNMVRNVFFKLCLIKMRLISLNNEKEREKITYIDIDRIFDTIEDINTLLNEIETIQIVTTTHNKVLSDIHFIYLEINTLHTYFKSVRKNLIRPTSNKTNPAIFPNPLNINLRLDIAISRISSTLKYLKEGYKNDFPNESGIENCAKYEYENKKTNYTDNAQ